MRGSEKDAIKYGLAVLKCDDSGDSDFAKGLRLLKSTMKKGEKHGQ
jgi:hypothetical protein